MLHQLGIPTATVRCLSTANLHILHSRTSASGAAINSKFFVGFTGVLQILLCLEPTFKPRHIHTNDIWMSAFGIFVSVYTLKFSTEAPALMKHGEIVQDLAVKNHNLKLCYENFRYLRLGHPQLYPWGNIHWKLWAQGKEPHQLLLQ